MIWFDNITVIWFDSTIHWKRTILPLRQNCQIFSDSCSNIILTMELSYTQKPATGTQRTIQGLLILNFHILRRRNWCSFFPLVFKYYPSQFLINRILYYGHSPIKIRNQQAGVLCQRLQPPLDLARTVTIMRTSIWSLLMAELPSV